MPSTNALTWRSVTTLRSIGVAITTSRKCPVQGRRYDDISFRGTCQMGAESELEWQTTGETRNLIKIFALCSQIYLIQHGLISNMHQLFNSSTASWLSKLLIVSWNTPRPYLSPLELLSDPPSNQHLCRDHRPQVYHLRLGADQVRTSFTCIPPDKGRKHHAERSACDVTPSHHLAAQWRWLWEDSPCGTSCSLAEERPAWSATSTAKKPKDCGRWAR